MNRENSRKELLSLTEDLQNLYRELHKEKEPGEFTMAEFMEANPKLTKTQASNFICHGVNNGILVKREDVFVDGKFRSVYKRAEKKV